MRVVVVSGLAGAGKSTAARALEDMGFFCVDNLPAALMGTLVNLAESSGQVSQVALVVDAREGKFLEPFPESFQRLKATVPDATLLYLEARDEVLLRRYSETRRRHPLAPEGGSVAEGIARERAILAPIKDLADQVIDTSPYSVHELKALVMERFGSPAQKTLAITLLSFGFKNGLPPELDLCADVRFLPNPFFVDELRAGTGLDAPVSRYVLDRPAAGEFLDRYTDLLKFLLPAYATEGKRYLTIGVGCTGGQHRSVAITAELARRLEAAGFNVRVRHRELTGKRGAGGGDG
ncbi:MAG: RNase adapter RapZ [Myxococcota bacterium]